MGKRKTLKPWTDEEIELLKDIYPHRCNNDLVEVFDRPKKSIRLKANSLGLYKTEETIKGIQSELAENLRGKVLKDGKRSGMRRAYKDKKSKCELCGYKPKLKNVLDIHHIVPVKENGTFDPNNLKTLCPTCHREVHLGLIEL